MTTPLLRRGAQAPLPSTECRGQGPPGYLDETKAPDATPSVDQEGTHAVDVIPYVNQEAERISLESHDFLAASASQWGSATVQHWWKPKGGKRVRNAHAGKKIRTGTWRAGPHSCTKISKSRRYCGKFAEDACLWGCSLGEDRQRATIESWMQKQRKRRQQQSGLRLHGTCLCMQLKSAERIDRDTTYRQRT